MPTVAMTLLRDPIALAEACGALLSCAYIGRLALQPGGLVRPTNQPRQVAKGPVTNGKVTALCVEEFCAEGSIGRMISRQSGLSLKRAVRARIRERQAAAFFEVGGLISIKKRSLDNQRVAR